MEEADVLKEYTNTKILEARENWMVNIGEESDRLKAIINELEEKHLIRKG